MDNMENAKKLTEILLGKGFKVENFGNNLHVCKGMESIFIAPTGEVTYCSPSETVRYASIDDYLQKKPSEVIVESCD